MPILPRDACAFCQGKTPAVLCIARDGSVIVPCEMESIAAGIEWVRLNGAPTAENFRNLLILLSPYNRALARCADAVAFSNLAPLAVVGDTGISDSFVVASNPLCHGTDLAACPDYVVKGHFALWKLLAEAAHQQDATFLGFYNSLNPLSGASVLCPHTQVQFLAHTPGLYTQMLARKQASGCAACRLLERGALHIPIPAVESLRLLAHPAPPRNWSLRIVSSACHDSMGFVNAGDFAMIFQLAVRGLAGVLGGLPPYNLVVRVGAGHFHADVIPRTNIPAGSELALGEVSVDVSPALVRDCLARALAR